jgi:hypothetical protein
MSNDFDFYGNGGRAAATPSAPRAPGPGPAPVPVLGAAPVPGYGQPAAVDRWGMPVAEVATAPMQAFAPAQTSWPAAYQTAPAVSLGMPPTAPSRRRAIVAVVVAVAVAAGAAAVYLSRTPHTIPLPPSLAGLSKISLKSIGSSGDFSATKKKLATTGVHDASFAVYGEPQSGLDLVVIAGHTSSSAPDFGQVVSAANSTGQISGIAITPAAVTSGASTFQCATLSVGTQAASLCEWQGLHAVLFGVAEGLSTQDTADALEVARSAANLH